MPDISFKLLQSELVPLTPELAQQFHTMPASPTERDLNPLRTKFLRQRILNGMAVPFHWSSAILDGKVGKVEKLEATVASLIATVKEQATQIQKVSARLETSKPAPQVVNNNQ